MYETWILRALALLDQSLNPIPNELNELDWKEKLSPNRDKLRQHLIALSNYPGGGFLVFGVRNTDAELVGVTKDQADVIVDKIANIGREAIDPPIIIEHRIENYQGVPLLFIRIRESMIKPLRIRGKSLEQTYIRSGGTTREASRQEIGSMMLNSKTPCFEELHCSGLISAEQVYEYLDVPKIAELAQYRQSSKKSEVLAWLSDQKIIESVGNGGYYITNFGAIAAAKDLNQFDSLSRKAIRFIVYRGRNKVETEREWAGSRGYAIRFEELINFVIQRLPSSEIIERALRRTVSVYPSLALRELIANALIHQDFSVRGSGPMIEVFEDRIEISNPGSLLPTKKIDRLIGTSSESRNEILAKSFRRYGICEERGSGFQKAVASVEVFGLPPLKFIEGTNSFKVIMYAPRSLNDMSVEERIEAVYQHSVIQFLSNGHLTNNSLRERLKLSVKQRTQVSLLIRAAIESGRIKPQDPENQSTKFAKYIPYWA